MNNNIGCLYYTALGLAAMVLVALYVNADARTDITIRQVSETETYVPNPTALETAIEQTPPEVSMGIALVGFVAIVMIWVMMGAILKREE